jgi:HK97 family phage major capsid protein|nr:MAG TPA: major capsid protein [Caudoviricetes sp.]
MRKNRWQLTAMRDGFADSLEAAKDKLTALLSDSRSTKEQREEQQKIVTDLTDRLARANAEIEEFDREAEAFDKAKHSVGKLEMSDEARFTQGYASLIRNTMAKQPITADIKAALKDDSGTTGGSNFLPKMVSDQVIIAPTVKNPLREHCGITKIENLELPKLEFTLSDDDFIADGETAKELEAKGSSVTFGRFKFKVFCSISETILNGSDADLTAYVNRALASGLAAKEKKSIFAASPKSGEEHMSFYDATVGIKTIKASSMYAALTNAIADLEDEYAENAAVCMRKADYYAMITALANGSSTLYGRPPEEILGVPVIFCDKATKPVVGDYFYLHINYAPDVIYDTDKDVMTGMKLFVLTAWIDIQIKMSAAFRIAEVSGD